MITVLCTVRCFAAPATAPSDTQTVKAIWDYSKELKLSDKQVAAMKSTFQELENTAKAAEDKLQGIDKTLTEQIFGTAQPEDVRRKPQQQLQALNKTLLDQINSGASADDVKKTLQEIATIQIELRLYEVKGVRAINEVKGGASLGDIRKTLQQAAEIQIQSRLNDLVASRKINGVMTAEQLSKWREIQRRDRAQKN